MKTTRNTDPTRQTLRIEACDLDTQLEQAELVNLTAGATAQTTPVDMDSQAALIALRDEILEDLCNGKF